MTNDASPAATPDSAEPTLAQALFRIVSAQVCIHAAMAGMRLAMPLWALKQGYSAGTVGLLIACYAMSSVLLSLHVGRFVDRHGLKRPVHIAVGVAFTACAVVLLWPVLPVMCAAAFAVGGAAGATAITMQRHVGRIAHTPEQLKTAFSWLSIGPAASGFIGPMLAGYLIDHAGTQPADVWGYRAAFAAMALLPLITWWRLKPMRELPTPAHVSNTAADAKPKRAWDLLAQPLFRRLLITNWLLSSCWDVHSFVVPILGHERGLSAGAIGTVLGVFSVAAVTIRMLIPLVAARIKEWQMITTAMGVTGTLLLVYPWLPSAWAMGACSTLLGFALGTVQPMVMSTLHQITPPDRHGEAIGMRFVAINLSSVVMPMLFGAAGATVGVTAVFVVVGLGVASGMPLAWRLRPPVPHSKKA